MKKLKCWRCWIEGERNTRAEFVTAGESRCLYHAGLHYLSLVDINIGYYVDGKNQLQDTSDQVHKKEKET